MGFLQNLAAATARKGVIAKLKASCPEALKPALDQLLGDNAVIDRFQSLATDALAGKINISADTLLKLPLPEAATKLLSDNKELVDYLVKTATSLLPGH